MSDHSKSKRRAFVVLFCIRVLEVFQERGESKGNKGSEDRRDQLGSQEEPLESEDQRDPRGQQESLANQEYLVFLEEQGKLGRQEDQEKR